MADAICLQDWISLAGGAGVTVTQDVREWKDICAYRDGVFYCEISAITGSANVTMQTSPTRDEIFFAQPSALRPFTGSAGVQLLQVSAFSAGGTPMAKWLRWQVTSAFAWSVSFRIWVSVAQARM